MPGCTLAAGRLTATLGGGPIAIELARLLRVRLYDCVVVRERDVEEFACRLVQPIAGGLRVQMVNEAEGLFIPVEFTAAGGQLRIAIKAGTMAEQMSINRRVMAIDLLPDLMATAVGDQGFYLLPDFSGTLVRFTAHQPTVTRDRIYMKQEEWEKLNVMNCYGAECHGRRLLAIVHRGDFDCHVVTEVNQGGRNRIYPSFGLRHHPGETVKQEDKEVILVEAAAGGCGYFRLAERYREYLLGMRGVSPLKERLAGNPVLAYSVRAMRTKIFHGLKPSSLDGNIPMNVYATFAQAEEILDAMWEAGLRKAVVTLVGWNLGGHDGAYPQRFPIEPSLGGEAGLKALIAKAKGMGYQIVPHDNLTDMYMAGQTYDAEVVLRNEHGTPVLGGIWGGGQAAKSCPVAYFDRYGPDVTRVRALGFDGHYYCDAQCNPPQRCHDPRHPADEEQFGLSQAKLVQAHRVLYGAVAIEVAPAFALPYIDEGNLHTPYNIDWCLQYVEGNLKRIIDRVVPFYQLAVHGLITYQEGWVHGLRGCGVRKGMLRALAFGVRPAMEVSYVPGANGDFYRDSIRDIGEGYRIAFEELADTHVELVADYQELGREASRIAYANGVVFEANWGDEAAGDLPPLSYRIRRPGAGG